ncbi:hypothetical protein GCM10011491_05580 [Brucella endophytica]|uniref:Tail tape measure protein n=1 Tax=Brucella endophytica TaxID=1963359 RepID=A0A916W9Z5_9HYPH|nr:hypothetical protein [Brucella endophytica]GGA81173.1 hypothetical protein GCM10011491_05580 [Brucella endophytica]
MANEEVLMVSIEARISELEKGMKKAQGVANAAYAGMKKNSRSALRDMERDAALSTNRINQSLATVGTKVGNFGKAFAGGIIGGIAAGGVMGIAGAVKDMTASFAELGREAKTAGINVEDFQRWRYVADQNKIGIDALIDGFKELNLRADEYIQTGKGSAAESFQRLGMSPAEVKERIKDPSALMLELIDRTKRLKDTAAGVRIFDELLGGQGGEQFVRLIEQGREGITDTINEADKMGAVFDEKFIVKAAEIDKKFNQVSTTVGSALKGAIVEAYEALAQFISIFQKFENRNTEHLKSQMNLLQRENDAAAGKLGGWFDAPARKTIEKNNAEIAKIKEELARRDKAMIDTPPIPDKPPVTPYVPPSTGKGGGGRTSADREREKAAREAERERKAVKDLIAELEFEASLVGKSAVEKEKLTALRNAGAAATQDERDKIEALVESTYRQNEAYEKTQEQLEELNDAGREFAGTLVSGLLNGAKASDVLADALGRLADRLINSGLDALFGGGGFGSMFSGIFGGGSSPFANSGQLAAGFGGGGLGLYARGTTFAPGGAAIVGEQGPELVNLPRGSQVTPNHMLGQGGSGTGKQAVDVGVEVNFNNDGTFEAFVTNIAQREGTRAAGKAVKAYDKTGPMRLKRDSQKAKTWGVI